jgi:hypothetical protein
VIDEDKNVQAGENCDYMQVELPKKVALVEKRGHVR